MKKKKMKQDHASCENAYQDTNNDLEKVNLPDGNCISVGATETCTIVTKKKKRKPSTEECAVYEAVPESIQIVLKKKKKTILDNDGDFSHEVESNGIGAKKKKKGEMIAEGSAAPYVPGNEGISPKKKKIIAGQPAAAPLLPEMKEKVPKKKKKEKMIAGEPTASSRMTKTDEVPEKKKKYKMTAEEPTATLVHGSNEIVPKKNKKKEKMIAVEPAAAAAPLTQEMIEKVPKKKRKEKMMAEEPIAASLMTKPGEALPRKKKKKDKKAAEEPAAPLVQETKEKVPKKKVKMNTAEPAAAPLVQEIKKKVPKKKKEKLISEEPTAALPEQEVKEKVKTKKKEKMMAKEPTSAPLVPEPNGTGPKKKKKEMMAEESASAPLVPEPNEMGTKKKRKTEGGVVQEASKIGQTKKKKKKCVAEESPVPLTELETKEFAPPMKKKCVTSDCVAELNVKKKKNKLKQDSGPNRDDATCIEGEMKAACIVDLPRPKKKTMSGVYEHSETSECQPVPDVSEQKKLKQKKNKSVTFAMEHSITSSDNGIAAPDADMSKSNHGINDSVVCHENNEAGGSGASSNESTSSKKHKKQKRKHSFPGDVESSENNKDAESDCAPARHCGGDETLAGISADPEMACAAKKKRCKEVKTISLSSQDDNPHAASYNEVGKKKKKIQKDDKTKQKTKRKTNKNVAEQISDRDEADGNEKEIQPEVADEDVMLVTVKEGNCDEVEIDTVRRKALQEEIDRESGNTKALRFGQWDTASFQSSGQQTKFLKLMGAFKKGNQVAFTPPAHHVMANKALVKEEEVVLERNLEDEFDKALNWKRNSGIGLGFQPERNKKFYIDKNSSKSVKFE